MLNDWKVQLANTRKAAATLSGANPKFVQAFQALNAALGSTGHLDLKTRELIALAVAVTTRCDGCIASHASAARQAGASEGELSEALATAIALNAGAAFVYSVRAMEAHQQFGESE
jgi:AhpD family alkylhydroperoxidase